MTLGLTDGPHTRGGGYQASSVWQPGPGGPTAGHAQRFTGGLSARFGSVVDLGTSVWIYDSESRATTRIGFWQGPYTRSDGYQRSELRFLGGAGLATGISVNYALGGHAAWVYDGPSGVTTRVGLVDAAHTRDDGFQDSTVDRFDESGLVAGQSSRYRPGDIAFAYQGESAWVYDSESGDSTRAGLLDAAHTKSDRFQRSSVSALGAGFAAGQSWRYAGDAEAGQSAWVYEVASETTTRVGLFDAGHAGFAGDQQSAVNLLDDSGHAAGWSARFAFGQIAAGRSAWIYDAASGASTTVGLFGADHVTPGGVLFSEVELLDDAG